MMPFLRPAILLAALASQAHAAEIPGLAVDGDTIRWDDTGGWMQVLDQSTYRAVPGCEGFVTSCAVPDGVYDVIDLSGAARENGVRVPDVASDDALANRLAGCGFQAGVGAPIRCETRCEAGQSLVGVTGCTAAWDATGERVPVQFEPLTFGNAPSWNGARCDAIVSDAARLAVEDISVTLGINCTR